MKTWLLGALLFAFQDPADRDPKSWVRPGPVPEIKLAKARTISDEEKKQILALIKALAKIDSPDFGLSSTLSGQAFSALEGTGKFQSGLLTDHALKPSGAMRGLVRFGPKALPFLLEALGDETPTEYTVKHEGGFGGMWFDSELSGNPANRREWDIVARNVQPKFGQTENVRSYTLKVGDACFVAVGQIVGRGYSAIRYQPTACIVINSPVQNRKLRDLVQEIWKSDDPARSLLDSLLLDYSTQGVFNGTSLDGWGLGSSLQCSAAIRLLYYYPEESAALISRRLDGLDGGRTVTIEGFVQREVKNGVTAGDFVEAVSWCSEENVRTSLIALMKKTDDPDLSLKLIKGVAKSQPAAVLQRLKGFIAALPAKERGVYDHGYHLLTQLAETFPADARPVFEKYLEGSGSLRRHTVCQVLLRVQTSWDLEVLGPLLTDRQATDYTYGTVPEKNEPRLPMRICDLAAEAIAAHHPEMSFRWEGNHANLDRQIETLRRQIAELKK